MPAPPVVLFALFALLASAGIAWIAHAEKGRRAALVAAGVALLFFAALGLGLLWFLRRLAGS